MIRRIIYFLLATIVLGGLAGAIAFYAFDFKPKFLAKVILGAPRPAQTVAAEPARQDSWQPQIPAIGSAVSVESIGVTPQVGGVIKELKFESGQAVKKGDLLVVLDTDTEVADMRSLEAQLSNANLNLSRKEELVRRGVAPRNDVDALRTQVTTLQASIDKLKAIIAQKSIYAPWDGRLGLRQVSVGSYVAPGQKLVDMDRVDPIYVDFTVTEEQYGKISPGQQVTASFSAFPDTQFQGKVVTTGGRSSESSRLITVRAEIANPDGKILPGMYANVLVDDGKPQQIVTVPQTAVTVSLSGDNVFVVVPANKIDPKAKAEDLAVERRVVKTAGMRAGRVEIASGLQPGERVVIAGQNKIDQGSTVVINNETPLKQQDTTTVQ